MDNELKILLVNKFKLSQDYIKKSLKSIINAGELNCRNGNCNALGPGAMSNFPDRYDGFHTYNRCCRVSEDKGRHANNMSTYNKDRRAYEYWSDGNIHAANKFMHSSFFKDKSADHVGPISLGFVHDPRYLRPMSKGDNSAKRDRLLKKDIDTIIKTENDTKVTPISWFSKNLWEYIKDNYESNPKLINEYRNALKQNIHDYMTLLWYILDKTGENGKIFLEYYYLREKLNCYQYNYTFDELGRITSSRKRNITDATRKEKERFIRISFESIEEYHKKDNRKLKNLLSDKMNDIELISNIINSDSHSKTAYLKISKLMTKLQSDAINKLNKLK